MNQLGVLERPKLLSRLNRRKVLAVVGSFVLLGVLVAFARYKDFPSLNQGIPSHIQVSGLAVTDSRYYCLGSFIDSEWLWQARVSESELSLFIKKYDLRSADGDSVPEAFLRMPAYWWRPAITGRTKILSTADFPIEERGPDGLHALATWNPEDEVLHVWIKNNF